MMLYASRAAATAAAERLKIYAQPQRLMILSRLVDGEHTVTEIEEATGIGQPALSQQLAALRRAAIVKTRRASKSVYYRLADEKVITCVRHIEAMFGDRPAFPIAPSPAKSKMAPPKIAHRSGGAASFVKLDPI